MKQVHSIKLIIVFVVTLVMGMYTYAQNSSLDQSTDFIKVAKELGKRDSDKTIEYLQNAHENFLKKGDTIQAIYALLEMPYHYGHKVNYAKSYDGLWSALVLSDRMEGNTDGLKACIYNRIGRLYSFYKKEEKAFEYLNASLAISKELVENGSEKASKLVNNYYLFCATYRELGKPEMSKIYLDSCNLYLDKKTNTLNVVYLDFEESFILAQEKEYDKALTKLKEIEPWFIENRPSYLVLIYTYWGDIYRSINNLIQSEKFYKKALVTSNIYNSHVDFSVLIHERLAKLYTLKGDYKNAFQSQEKAKTLDALFFDSRSEANQPLLEIKDEFRIEKERQEKLLQQQRVSQLEKDDKISFLQRIILLCALVLTFAIAGFYVMQIRAKHKIEKELIKRNKELEIQKARELLELKNKELATSALQLVEKDEFLKELKSKLQGEYGGVKTDEIHKVLKSISTSNQNNWEEFKLRFTAVNEEFYNKVTTKYPKLSQSDQKICALVKLNFSSKEMARLLGISVQSVHTTRYRLRKKMGLDRSVNLEEFIASL